MPSVLPAAVVSNQSTIASSGFSPDVVMDPINSQKMVEVDTTGSDLVAYYSTNGGQTWTNFINAITSITDPTAAPQLRP